MARGLGFLSYGHATLIVSRIACQGSTTIAVACVASQGPWPTSLPLTIIDDGFPAAMTAHLKASILKSGRVVFNIKANDYRLVACVQYEAGVLMIRLFGSHGDYDKINAETI